MTTTPSATPLIVDVSASQDRERYFLTLRHCLTLCQSSQSQHLAPDRSLLRLELRLLYLLVHQFFDLLDRWDQTEIPARCEHLRRVLGPSAPAPFQGS